MAPQKAAADLIADMTDKRMINVLFLCNDSSCRSPVAEALLNFIGKGRFWAFSAGFISAKEINPMAIELMREAGIPCGGLKPKGWRSFTTPSAPQIDVVVCMAPHLPLVVAASFLPGNPIIVSWPIENPVTVRGSHADRRSACGRMLRRLEERILELAGTVSARPCEEQEQVLLTKAA